MNRTIDQAKNDDDFPWPNENFFLESRTYVIYRDGYPVTHGHLLFIPKEESWENVVECWKAAYRWGHEWIENGFCESFNLGQNVGEQAGQTVNYPHVHLIPRRKGDTNNVEGGVRKVVHENAEYTVQEKTGVEYWDNVDNEFSAFCMIKTRDSKDLISESVDCEEAEKIVQSHNNNVRKLLEFKDNDYGK